MLEQGNPAVFTQGVSMQNIHWWILVTYLWRNVRKIIINSLTLIYFGQKFDKTQVIIFFLSNVLDTHSLTGLNLGFWAVEDVAVMFHDHALFCIFRIFVSYQSSTFI